MILLQIEEHLAAYMLGVAPYLIAGRASPDPQPEENTFILTDNCVHVRLAGGFEFDLPVLKRQDIGEPTKPCLIVSGIEATQQGCTLNHEVAAEVEIRYPADAGEDLGSLAELLAAFRYAAGQLQLALYRHDLAELVTNAVQPDEFTCFQVLPDLVQQSDFIGRARVYRIRLRCICASDYIPQVEPVP
jgi:hypothetical protein